MWNWIAAAAIAAVLGAGLLTRTGVQDDAPPQDTRVKGVHVETPFPPTMPDTDWHREGWIKNDCLRCHETGVGEAPAVRHTGLPIVLLTAKCRTCHVLIPGQKPRGVKKAKQPPPEGFAPNAFPPMIPASGSHRRAWMRDDCHLCHELGISGAPKIVHEGLPPILLKAKCRSCHVQIRSVQATLPVPATPSGTDRR